MSMVHVEIATPDGTAGGTVHSPDGRGPWPAVIMYPDAGGVRPVFSQMGDRLSAERYVVLVPDVYYRSGGFEPFSMATAFSDPGERQRLQDLMASLTPERIAADAVAFADFLGALDSTTGALGTTGYCLGGRISLLAAGYLGPRLAAAASFHGGHLAVEGDPASPYRLAAQVRGVVYVGGAQNDASFDDDQAARLHDAYEAAGSSTASSGTRPGTASPWPTFRRSTRTRPTAIGRRPRRCSRPPCAERPVRPAAGGR